MSTFDHHVGTPDTTHALARLLPMLLDPDMDPDDIAREFLATPAQVAHWSTLPKLRDVLASLREIYTLRLDILLLKARVGALSTLDQICRAGETSGRGAETTRRAASSILKLNLDPATPPTKPTAPRTDPPPRDPRPHTPPAPDSHPPREASPHARSATDGAASPSPHAQAAHAGAPAAHPPFDKARPRPPVLSTLRHRSWRGPTPSAIPHARARALSLVRAPSPDAPSRAPRPALRRPDSPGTPGPRAPGRGGRRPDLPGGQTGSG